MLYLQILSGIIAFSSIVSNLLVCVLFCFNKLWLRRPYNVFLLNLAVTDMMTGLFMFLTPGMVVDEPVRIPRNAFMGDFYCKLLWSRLSLFFLGAVSVYTSVVLTIERWTAICRPFKYRTRFASRWLLGYVFLIWGVSIAMIILSANNSAKYHPASGNSTVPQCKIATLFKGTLIDRLTSTIAACLKFFVPFVVIVVLYALAIFKVKTSDKFSREIGKHKSKSITNVTRMAGVASMALIACWFPNQIYYILYKFNHTKLFTVFHNITNLIVFLNSTINPFIYALWGQQFRAGIKKLLGTYLCKIKRHRTIGHRLMTVSPHLSTEITQETKM